MRNATISVIVAALVVLVAAPLAEATPFPVSGGSYTANVVQRRDADGNFLGVLTPTYNGCGDQWPSFANVADGGHSLWALAGMGDGDGATMRIQLDQTYTLNQIVTKFGDFHPDEHEVRISPDASSWTTVHPRGSAAGATYTDPFAAQDVLYIEWELFGPGADLGGGPSYAYQMELMAFVASTAAEAPQLEGGYNVSPTGAMGAGGGWVSWGPPQNMTDGNPHSYAIPGDAAEPAVLDLGQAVPLCHMRLDFAYAQNWDSGTFEISEDLSSWTTIFTSATSFSNTNVTFPTQLARYLRITGSGGGALSEVMLFGTEPEEIIPEPATVVLVATGGLMLARRRRR